MKSVKVLFQVPSVRDDAVTPLPLDEIAGVEISASVSPDLLGYTVYSLVEPVLGEYIVPDLEPGRHTFRGVVVDTDGQRSEPLTFPIDIPKPPPGELLSLTVQII